MKLTIRYDDGREVVEHCLGWGHATKIARELFRPAAGLVGERVRDDHDDPIAAIEYDAGRGTHREYCRPAEIELRLRWLRDTERGKRWAALFDERGGA